MRDLSHRNSKRPPDGRFVLGVTPMLEQRSGGTFQHTITMLEALSAIGEERPELDVLMFTKEADPQALAWLESRFRVHPLYGRSVGSRLARLVRKLLVQWPHGNLVKLLNWKLRIYRTPWSIDTVRERRSTGRWLAQFGTD